MLAALLLGAQAIGMAFRHTFSAMGPEYATYNRPDTLTIPEPKLPSTPVSIGLSDDEFRKFSKQMAAEAKRQARSR